MPVPSLETQYTHSVPYPDTLVLGRPTTVGIRLVRDGVAVAGISGTVTPVDPAGAESTPVLGADASGTFVASVPSSATDGKLPAELWQLRWRVEVEAGVFRVFRRPAVVAKFVLSPPITDSDLTSGGYPDLVDQLASFGETGPNGEATLQPYIDKAWAKIIRLLFKQNRWSDKVFSVHDLYDLALQGAYEHVFRFLKLKSRPESNVVALWEYHRKQFEHEWRTLSARWDSDADGIPDGLQRDEPSGAVALSVAPRKRLAGAW